MNNKHKTDMPYIVRSQTPRPENPARCWSEINIEKLKRAASLNVDYYFLYTINGIEYRYSIPACDLLHAFEQQKFGKNGCKWTFYVEYRTGKIFKKLSIYYNNVAVKLKASERPIVRSYEDSEDDEHIAGRNEVVPSVNDALDYLEECGIDEIDYARALLLACYDSDVKLVKCLLVAGADANGDGRHYGYETSLPICAVLRKGTSEKSSLRIIKALLESEADVDARDDDGNTPLYLAIESGSKRLVKLLLDYGAEVNIVTSYGTPYEWAEECGEEKIMELLLEYGAEDEV